MPAVNDVQRASLEDWVSRIGASRIPIFTQTVHEVSGVASRIETSAHDLARAIGRDASLAARLLKVANSPLFNLQGRNIDTISSAVVLLGFDAVRELAVSLSLIEQVLQGRRHERVTQSLARAFHAAAQARSFAARRRDPGPEEVFVAGLLLHVGEMAFWSLAEKEAAAIDRMTRSGASLAEAEQRVLGFRLEALTARLVDEWRLGTLLERIVAGGDAGGRADNVRLGHEVAAAVEQFGWESSEVSRIIDRIARHLEQPRAAAVELVSANVQEATKIAARYGVPKVERYLLEDPAGAAAACAPEPVPAPVRLTPDAALQLKTLQEIAALLEGRPELDELVRLVLRGIHQGVGLERAWFALLSPDRRRLTVRHAVGAATPDGIAVDVGAGAPRNLFGAVLDSAKAMRVAAERRSAVAPLLTDALRDCLSVYTFVLMPVMVAGRPVGLLYADNAASGSEVDEDAFSAFRHFGQQIGLGIARMRRS
ncbi:MAG: HDOD domain-containing protein [Pseudomonadales bacterium]